MLITICDVPDRLRGIVEEAGGQIVRSWNRVNDVQFEDHKMRVTGDYVKVRQFGNSHILVLYRTEFSNIYIQ